MNKEQEGLANALVIHPSFRWKVGMQGKWLAEYPSRFHRISHTADIHWVEGRALPDLTDAATVGCLIYFLSDSGIKNLVHGPLTKEEFGNTVAKVLLDDWNGQAVI